MQKKHSLAIWPFFGLFWMWSKIVYFEASFGEIWAKLAIFYEILTLNLVIYANFWGKFGLYLAFYRFWGFVLFETAYGQILLFLFFWTWQPWSVAQNKKSFAVWHHGMVENCDKKEKACVHFCSSSFLFFQEKSDSQK